MVYFCKKKFKIGLENKQTVSVVKHVKMWQFILCSVHSARSAIHISFVGNLFRCHCAKNYRNRLTSYCENKKGAVFLDMLQCRSIYVRTKLTCYSKICKETNLPLLLQSDNLSDVKVWQIRTQLIGQHFCPGVIRTVRAT